MRRQFNENNGPGTWHNRGFIEWPRLAWAAYMDCVAMIAAPNAEPLPY